MSEEKQASVIVVAEVPFGAEGAPRERRYDASQAEVNDIGQLRLLHKGRDVGVYQYNAWRSWREEGAIVNDGPVDKRKLAIALEALREIDQDEDSNSKARSIAEDALADIADVDL